MTVQVAIDLALDRLFTYAVPAELEGKLAVGQLLSVPFGHREACGFALAVRDGCPEEWLNETKTAATEAKPAPKPVLRHVTAIVDETPFFSETLLELVKKVSAYTASPIETVLRAALPAAVLRKNARPRELMFIEPALGSASVALTKRQQWLYDQIARLGGGWMSQLCEELSTTPATIRELGRKGLVTVTARPRRRDPLGAKRILPTKPLELNAEQRAALEQIEGEVCAAADETPPVGKTTSDSLPGPSVPKPVLLFGVTGSGKTEVYLQAIARELEQGRGAIVMVPEIALTPQTVRRFASRFGARVAVLHSALSDGERYDEWHRIRSGEARVVVGPRSAVWAPVRDLGLIVVDEEHEPSYKQDETPRYHARDVAVLRGRLERCRVVLGSATPSLESWMNARRGKYALATMRLRAGSGRLPAVQLVDLGEDAKTGGVGGAIFSKPLLEAISLRLDRGEQTILFLNRRGYSRQVVCGACGFVVTCPGCGLAYTYHRVEQCLRCHVCGRWIPVPGDCPQCHARTLSYKGIGTERAEAALRKCFPHAAILRMDADATARKNTHDDILGAFARHEADILVGTQMIAKGLDFPNVTLVGVLNADSSLNMPDLRAGERSFQLFAQVAGRAGRAELPGEVFIQTRDTSSPILRAVVRGGFEAFAEEELKTREQFHFPPFCHLALVRFRGTSAHDVAVWAEMYARSLAAYANALARPASAPRAASALVVSEAMPSALEKADGQFRWQIMLRAAATGTILRAWRWIRAARPVPKDLRVALDVDALNLV